ncbi:kinase-like domain-containing protein, partial [Boletus coccyginus]
MSSQIPRSRGRPLVDLTDRLVRDSAIHIAGGAFGDVYKCRCRDTLESSSFVAVKSLRYFESEDPEENRRKVKELNNKVRRELGLLRRLEHPNIVPLLGVTQGFGPPLAAVSPWMLHGTLHSFLKHKGQMLTVVERLQLVHDIGCGLEHLHSIPVSHGDLHSSNVLIDEEQNPRISDFGLATTIGRLQPGLSYLQRLSSTNNVGVARWAAPERLDGCKPSTSGDMYSFGCIMFEVLSGDIPWKEEGDYQVIALKLKEHRPPSRPVHIALGDQHWMLMLRCWSCPQRRPTAHDVVVVVQTLSSESDSRGDAHFFFFFFGGGGYI